MAKQEEKKKKSDLARAVDSAYESLSGAGEDFRKGWESLKEVSEKSQEPSNKANSAALKDIQDFSLRELITGSREVEKPEPVAPSTTDINTAREYAAKESEGKIGKFFRDVYNTLTEPKDPQVPLGYGVGLYQTGKRKLPKAEEPTSEAATEAPAEQPAPTPAADQNLRDRLDSVEAAVKTTTKVLSSGPKPKAPAAGAPAAPQANYTDQFQSDVKALRDAYTTQMKTLREQEDQEQAKIDKREAVQALIQAVGQLSSAYYGLKKGVDMSGVKFESKDFDKVRERIMEKFKTEKALSGRELETGIDAATKDRAFKLQEATSREQLRLEEQRLADARAMAAERNAMMQAIQESKSDTAKANARLKLAEAEKKAGTKILNDVRSIYARSGLNDDEKGALAQSALVQYGIDPVEAKSLVTDEGIIWDSAKDMEDALEAITTRLAVSGRSAPASGPAAVASDEAERIINQLMVDNKDRGLTREQAEALVRENRPDLF